jgi:hypothetical protein
MCVKCHDRGWLLQYYVVTLGSHLVCDDVTTVHEYMPRMTASYLTPCLATRGEPMSHRAVQCCPLAMLEGAIQYFIESMLHACADTWCMWLCDVTHTTALDHSTCCWQGQACMCMESALCAQYKGVHVLRFNNESNLPFLHMTKHMAQYGDYLWLYMTNVYHSYELKATRYAILTQFCVDCEGNGYNDWYG